MVIGMYVKDVGRLPVHGQLAVIRHKDARGLEVLLYRFVSEAEWLLVPYENVSALVYGGKPEPSSTVVANIWEDEKDVFLKSLRNPQ